MKIQQKISHQRKKRISRDFHFSTMTVSQLAEYYKISESTAYKTSKQIPAAACYEEKPKMLIKIYPEDYEKVTILLDEAGIENFQVAPKFELLEYYESSIK